MEDCELFKVCSTEIRSVVISISSIIINVIYNVLGDW